MRYQPTAFTFMFAGQEGYVDEHNVATWNGTTFPVKHALKAIKYAIEMERLRVLNVPESLRFYDNSRYSERYTVLFMDEAYDGSDEVFGLSLQADGTTRQLRGKPGFNLGSRIFLGDLTDECKQAVMGCL